MPRIAGRAMSSLLVVAGNLVELIGAVFVAFEAMDRVGGGSATRLVQSRLRTGVVALDSYVHDTRQISTPWAIVGFFNTALVCWFPLAYSSTRPSGAPQWLDILALGLFAVAIVMVLILAGLLAWQNTREMIAWARKSRPIRCFWLSVAPFFFIVMFGVSLILGFIALPLVFPLLLALRLINLGTRRLIVRLEASPTFPRTFRDVVLILGVLMIVAGLLVNLLGEILS